MWAIFNDESADWTEAEAVETDFQSKEEAESAIVERYEGDDSLVAHLVEQPEDEDDFGGEEDDEEDE